MSSSDRRTFLLAAAATALAGCGFAPVYGPGGAAQGLRGQIVADPPDDDAGYILVRRLEERLGTGANAPYRLAADIALDQDALAISNDQEITRYQLRGQLTYALTHIASGDAVAGGTLSHFTAYSAPVFSDARSSIAGNTVSVLTAERDARDRLMTILADNLVSRLLATAPEWRR